MPEKFLERSYPNRRLNHLLDSHYIRVPERYYRHLLGADIGSSGMMIIVGFISIYTLIVFSWSIMSMFGDT